MIKHVVLLNWKEGVTQQQIDSLTAGFAALPNKISEIKTYQFGADAAIFKGNASYALVAEFESEEDLKVYARHPDHQALLADLAGPMLESFQSVQFVVD